MSDRERANVLLAQNPDYKIEIVLPLLSFISRCHTLTAVCFLPKNRVVMRFSNPFDLVVYLCNPGKDSNLIDTFSHHRIYSERETACFPALIPICDIGTYGI